MSPPCWNLICEINICDIKRRKGKLMLGNDSMVHDMQWVKRQKTWNFHTSATGLEGPWNTFLSYHRVTPPLNTILRHISRCKNFMSSQVHIGGYHTERALSLVSLSLARWKLHRGEYQGVAQRLRCYTTWPRACSLHFSLTVVAANSVSGMRGAGIQATLHWPPQYLNDAGCDFRDCTLACCSWQQPVPIASICSHLLCCC